MYNKDFYSNLWKYYDFPYFYSMLNEYVQAKLLKHGIRER